MLNLQIRSYRTLPIDNPDYESHSLPLEPGKTALIVMHCWNIGLEDGPPIDMNFYVGMGFPATFREAGRIMRECIRPAMDSARKAGVTVCHVETEGIAAKHPDLLDKSDIPPKPSTESPSVEAEPGWRARMLDRFHGKDYPSRSPLARMDRAALVAPLPGEPFVYLSSQLERELRRREIENLIYCGFCADLCVLRAPGGVEQMAGGNYRLFLMRDATVGCEMPETFHERVATRWAIAYFETHFGDTLLTEDFLRSCDKQGEA